MRFQFAKRARVQKRWPADLGVCSADPEAEGLPGGY
jgi:hypothetical protein